MPLTATLVAMLAWLLLAANAHAVVYWQSSGPTNGLVLNRANVDGTQKQVPWVGFGVGNGVADLTAHAGFLYWVDMSGPSNGLTAAIGRMRANGTMIEDRFIPIDAITPPDLAVNSSGIYWTSGSGTIARADLNGSNVNGDFITPSSRTLGQIAASETHVFWSGTDGGQSVIARANTDGTGVNETFVRLPGSDLASLAASDAHVYWADGDTGGIGRAAVDGSDANPSFAPPSVTGRVYDLAVGGPYLFWANTTVETVGRMGLDGSGANQRFGSIGDDDHLDYIAADALVIPNVEITKAPKRKTTKRKAEIAFQAPNAPDASFQCSLDGGDYDPCSSPETVKVRPGRHKFRVLATNETGSPESPVAVTWKVLK